MILHWCMKCGKAYDDYTYCPECDTPPAPERREPCKWYAKGCPTPCTTVEGCIFYEPQEPVAATGDRLTALQERVNRTMNRFMVATDFVKNPILSMTVDPSRFSPIAGGLLAGTKPEDVVAWIKQPMIDGKIMREWLAKLDNFATNNKEDNDMSGNAFICESCRGTFLITEVHKVGGHSLKYDRNEKKVEHDLFNEACLCDKCYAKFRKATAPFNFPWDEWRKGDDDDE